MKFKNFDIADMFGPDDVEQAKGFIGKLGFFENDLDDLDNAITYLPVRIYKLVRIKQANSDSKYVVNDACSFKYFLPLEKVKKTEPVKKEVKYRPIKNMLELADIMYGEDRHRGVISTGDLMTLERKKDRFRFRILITQLEYENDLKLVSINDKTLKNLFDDYKVMNVNGIFVLFGVKIEDE